MKTLFAILFACFIVVVTSCSKEFASPKDSNIGVFEELSQFVEENYALFEIKQVDWALVKAHYYPKVSNLITQDSFFSICRSAVNKLKDGNSSVSKGDFPIGYDFRDGYDVQFKPLVALDYVKQSTRYYNFGTFAGVVNDTTVYIQIASFFNFSSDNWEDAMNYLARDQYKKVIIDMRSTYSGQPVEAFYFAGYFMSSPKAVGSIVHKSGKGPKDFKKVPVVIPPVSPYLGNKKIIILTNRHTFSVSTYVTAILQTLPNVTLIGQTTGPGSGTELPYELPNGWIVAVASNYFLPANGRPIEDGIKPDIEINNTALDLQNKRDRMLERAIAE